jgi:MerR family transcriptional regulator, Zn(II)-responsive regulator of zntA
MEENKFPFLVKDLAKYCDVTTDAIRYYTRLSLLKPVRDPANKYNLYNNEDVQKLRFITRAKYLGYKLSDIAKIFKDCEKGKSPCPRVRKIIEQRIPENRKRLQQQMLLQQRMESALLQWDKLPDGIPDGDTICALIESFEDG